MSVKLKKLLKEGEEEEQHPLTPEEKKSFLEAVRNFGKYGKQLRTENDLVQIADEINHICKMVERVTLEEADEWFDKMTINRNLKELKRINSEFNKTSKSAKQIQERMVSLYEDMGHVINRYFEIANDEDKIEEPPPIEENIVTKGDKFILENVKWLVTVPGITQSRVIAISSKIKGKTGISDNKMIIKNKIK